MLQYSKVLLDNIEREKSGIDYYCDGEDKLLLNNLLEEVNVYAGTNLKYLAEIDAFNISGSGCIYARYIDKFISQSVRGYMIHQLVSDRIKDCDRKVLQLYKEFKTSDDYFAFKKNVLPVHICIRYDDAIKKLKPKRLAEELIELACCPRDFFYLPFTMKMLSSWKIQGIEEVLLRYSKKSNVTKEELGIEKAIVDCIKELAFIQREIRFTAIDSLKYYPSYEIMNVVKEYTLEYDRDIQITAKKTLSKVEKALNSGR